MIRTAEAVLDGHPDKFCDILADRLLGEAYKVDPECYGQIEVAVWSDAIWLSGAIVTRDLFQPDLKNLVVEVGTEIGYVSDNAIDAARYRILNEACFSQGDPTQWTHSVNDQSIVIGWAGYDAKTRYLAPEQFLAHSFRKGLVASCRKGRLKGQGPDGKLMVLIREEGQSWILESILTTLQQKEELSLLDLGALANADLEEIYQDLQRKDSRWVRPWWEVDLLVNPNGPLLNGGSDGDNGQTGRKLVMDYYGPRVPLGGGALSGKDFTQIDRAAAYGARQAAVTAVASGASSCQVTLIYAPNRREPLDIIYDMEGRGKRMAKDFFRHDSLRQRYSDGRIIARLGDGCHFFDDNLPWNQPAT